MALLSGARSAEEGSGWRHRLRLLGAPDRPSLTRSEAPAPYPAPERPRRAGSALHAVRHFAAVLGELAHDRLVQRDVLLGAAVRPGVDAQFLAQLLARAQAGIEA